MVRGSGLDYTVVKAGMIYGRGDHMLDHLSHSLHTMPLFLKVGMSEKPIRPVPVEDLVHVLRAAIVEGRLSNQTVAVMGAEELQLSEAGHEQASRLAKSLAERHERLLAALLPDEQEALAYGLSALVRALRTV